MKEQLFYSVIGFSAPVISLCDTAHIKPPYVHFRRKASEYILYYIHSGELSIREDDREYLLSEGQYLLLDPACEHEGLRATTCNFTYIHFSLCGLTISTSDYENFISESPVATPIYFPKYGRLDAEDIAEDFSIVLSRLLSHVEENPVNTYLQSSQLCELLALLALQYRRRKLHAMIADSGTASYVPALKRFLEIHYSTEINSRSLEDLFHCNFDHLNRVFKKMTGNTVFATLNRIRIEKAKKYLATGFYTCNEVAVKCGFHDVYYFSRVFKKMTGMSPVAYKKSCQAGI